MTDEAGWITDTEKLRCHIVLDDDIARLLSPRAGPAYFRAFVVEDRATHRIGIKFRYRYRDPDRRNWFQFETDKPDEEGVSFLVGGIRKVLMIGAAALNVPVTPEHIKEFYPPDDNGDPTATVIWLEMHDLIEITEVNEL